MMHRFYKDSINVYLWQTCLWSTSINHIFLLDYDDDNGDDEDMATTTYLYEQNGG